jgi:hypothetical protein
MSAGARVAIFVALLAVIFVVAILAGRALHPRSAADDATSSGGRRATASVRAHAIAPGRAGELELIRAHAIAPGRGVELEPVRAHAIAPGRAGELEPVRAHAIAPGRGVELAR